MEILAPPARGGKPDPKDILVETMRARGPGGQHLNKTESAVRARHLPSGLTAVAREERSQHRNRKLALSRLTQLMDQNNTCEHNRHRQMQWQGHNLLERGNPVKVFRHRHFIEQ